MSKMRVLELYSGIGGMHYALEESGIAYEVVASVDINTAANEVYRHNFPNTPNLNRNIECINVEQIKKLSPNAILMSPPCQPFTRVGLKKDVLDERTGSLLHVLELIPCMETLEYILVENVKGFEISQARDELVHCIVKSGFNFKECILSPCQFGIPNTRHRYYLIAKKIPLPFYFHDSSLIKSLPPGILDVLPPTRHEPSNCYSISDIEGTKNCYKLECILEKNVNEQDYLLPEKILKKHVSVLDLQTPSATRSCCFTKAYTHYAEGTGSVLSLSSELGIVEKFRQIKTHNNESEKYLELLTELKIRYFTPREVSRLMYFPENFNFPEITTKKQKYRLLGNSINVYVVSKLIQLLNHVNTHG